MSVTTDNKMKATGIEKIAFGFGMLTNQMFPAILGIFMVVLVQDMGFPGWMWSLIFLFPRIFDAITDPIMGFISDNTKSKWGRRRQYVFIGGLIMGLSLHLYVADLQRRWTRIQFLVLPFLVYRILFRPYHL